MRKIRIDLIFWIFYFVFGYLSDEVLYPKSYLGSEIALFLSHNLFLFYGLYYCLIKFSKQTLGKTILSITRIASVILVFFVLRYYVRLKLLPFYYGDVYGVQNIQQCFTTGAIWVVNYFFFASAYYYFSSSRNKQARVNMLIQQALEKEKEKLELENALLRSQINPHFLYNTLNYLYAQSLPHSEALSDGILKLSDVMRYSLQAHDKDGLVYLKAELEHIQNVLEINKLRFGDNLGISFAYPDDIANIKIVPMVLITLVENVLKHGDLGDAANVATINTNLSPTGQLHFTTWNKKRSQNTEPSTGIGLNNSIKRLENAYGKDFLINVEDNKDSFALALQIQLTK